MIETVGEMIERLKELDPNLRLLPNDGTSNFSIDEVHQVSADFVKISLEFLGYMDDPK